MAQTEQFRPVCANAIREPWQFDTEIAIKLSAATRLPAEHRRMVGVEKEREGANGGGDGAFAAAEEDCINKLTL